MEPRRRANLSAIGGRVFLALALLAAMGAWLTQVTGSPLLGMTQQHLFSDSTVLALFGIGWFLDALFHAKGF